MKMQRTTLILLLVALSLTGFVYFYEIKGAPQREATKEKQQQIFDFRSDRIQSFTVKNPDKSLTIERVSDRKNKENSWQIKSPIQGPANEASVVFLLDKLTTGKSDRTLSVASTQLAEFGLDKPQATIDVKLDNQQTRRLILGKPDFSTRFLYAQVDPPEPVPQTVSVILVPIDFKSAADRPISEWQQTEKKEDSSPTPSSTSSPAPSPESSSPNPTPQAETTSPSPSPTPQVETTSPSPGPTPSPELPSPSPTPQAETTSPSSSPTPSPESSSPSP